jgi:MFS family permease
VLGSSLTFIDGSALGVALPAIQRDLGAGPAAVQWVSNAYLLTLGALVLIGGAAGDRFGRRRVFLIGVAIFTLASVACGLAPSVELLIGARAVQGIGAALLTPGALALIGATFPPEERGKAFGAWAGAGAIFGMVGPLVGGWLADHADWRAIFWINVPLAAIAALITLKAVPESRDAGAKGLDWLGALLAVTGLAALTWGLTAAPDLGWPTRGSSAALVGGTCAAGRLPVGRGAGETSDDAAGPVPLPGVQRDQSADPAALFRVGRGDVLPAVRTDPGARLDRDRRGRGHAALRGDHGAVLGRRRDGSPTGSGRRLSLSVGPILAGVGLALLAV